MTIRELLRSIQLENLTESFEKENITPDILKDLTDADLRELGVASMADRKRLMRLGIESGRQDASQISRVSPSAGSTPAPSAAPADQNWPRPQGAPSSASGAAPNADPKAERVFYEGVVEGATVGKSGGGEDDDGGDDDVAENVSIRVTSHRAIIGPKTFLLHNIAAVQVGTKKGESPKSIKISAVVCAVICFAIAIGMACSEGDNAGAAGCCGAVGLACLAGLFAKGKPAAYSVRIDASGTSSDAISSKNKAKMQEIVDAINQAIVNLNVAK
jgi:hypothetical protein